MNRYTTCAVPGCEDRKSSRHRFPNPVKDRERFNLWIEVLANPKLVQMDPTRVFDNFRVCHQHFTINDKSSNMFLKRTAIPSQNLPSKTGNNFEYYNYIRNNFQKYKKFGTLFYRYTFTCIIVHIL